jgi:cytidyltransferase-like protein
MLKQYSMFVGRYQPWHEGHRWLIDQRLKEGKNVWVAIRSRPDSPDEPWGADRVQANIKEELKDLIEEGKVFVSIIPDIESINYGRGVGYDIIEHTPPNKVEKISATKIRAKLRKDGKL